MSRSSAFTLVELMVAMAIIAVLMAFTVFAIGLAQSNLRDEQRRDAVKSIATALATYVSINQSLPATSAVTFSANQVVITGGLTVPLEGPAQAGTTTSTDHSAYCYSITPVGYKLGVYLESNAWFNLGNPAAQCSGTPPGGDTKFP